jgi:aminoglycoside phosphotransferase (APT) family kinase protein
LGGEHAVPDVAEAVGTEPLAAKILPDGPLATVLRKRFPQARGALVIERASGGLSNPTFFVTCGEWSVVLRKQPAMVLERSAHAIDREYLVLCALQGSAVPVPKPIFHYPQADVIGTPFYIMERLRGRVFTDSAMPGLSWTERRGCYEAMCDTMAELHRFDWRAAGLADYGRPGNYFERQLKRWSDQWQKLRSADNPYVDELIAWLRARVPQSPAVALCHGDFRVSNLMFHATESRVIGVLDWELSTLGHPLADVAFNLQPWRMRPEENGGIRGLDLASLGIPGEREYLERYYNRFPGSEPLRPVHVVFAMFRAAVGCAGIAVRAAAGPALNAEASRIGKNLALAYARAGIEAMSAAS